MVNDDAYFAGHSWRWLSAAGGFVAILLMLWISTAILEQRDAAVVVASMGASVVLLFALPGGALSRPWPLIGGHLVSAVIGVTIASAVENPLLAASIAVGAAMVAMHYLKCIHPPGGATALVAVLGGEGVHTLGYAFLLTPVLENLLVILLVSLLFNRVLRQRYATAPAR